MQTLIDFYIKSRELKMPFKTARSEISQKDILILIFDNQFAFELPLSPSLGEIVKQTVEMAKNGISSPMVKRALSFYKGMHQQDFSYLYRKASKSFHTVTYSIGDYDLKKGDYLQRFKGSPENIENIIDWSQSNTDFWTVDFNGSLDKECLTFFIQNANLKNCLFIEQPLSPGHLSLPLCSVPYWADEGLKELTPNKFLESAFKGFMLKPLAYDFSDFIQWIQLAQSNLVPFFISGVVCDNLFWEFLKFWNKCSTYQNIYPKKQTFFQQSLPIEKNPYITGEFKDVISYVKSSYNFITQIELSD